MFIRIFSNSTVSSLLRLMGEARLHFGFARPFGCLVTVGTGMEPNVSLPPEGTNVFNNITGTVEIVKALYELATKGEQANQMAQPLCEEGTYYRFNLGEKIKEKRWVERVDPTAFQRWFGDGETKYVEHFTPENWAKVTIDLADYKKMGEFVKLTEKYIQSEDVKVGVCAGKIPPKRPAPTVA